MDLFQDEVVRVKALNLVGAHECYANSMIDHELGELGAIHENDCALNRRRIRLSLLAEIRSRDEDSLASTLPLERPCEALDLRATDGRLPPLGLNVDDI